MKIKNLTHLDCCEKSNVNQIVFVFLIQKVCKNNILFIIIDILILNLYNKRVNFSK